ncbi:MAG: HD domain-containing protein [Parcubacteria group bacterium]
MKQKFVNELKFGDKLNNEQFAVKNVRYGKTANGKDYIDLALTDKTGEIAAKIWEDCIGSCDHVENGDVVELSGVIEEFRDKLQLRVTFMQKEKDIALENFLPTTKKDIDVLWQILEAKIFDVKDKNLKKLLEHFFTDEEFVKKFKQSPAAERLHHAYLGGLLEHTVEMLNQLDPLIIDFPILNKDLMIAGVILHDIGKTEELTVSQAIIRTTAGHLIGHLTQGALLVDKAIDKIKKFPTDLRGKLINMLISHHEKMEFGCPVKPMTREAYALCHLDNLSAKINMADRVIGESQGNGEFTDYNHALETRLYIK